ncbi:MAG: lamin tail domain-containing protein [Bacteroidota bacterium]|nr:lamin tail domain-containing protein [Bacteroidota bacterium]
MFCILISYLLPGQVEDDFSDGDLLHDPVWLGDLAQFRVNDDLQLQVYSEGASESCLSTYSTALQNGEWRFWVRLSFSPSANNNARIYLASDQQDLKSPLNGYFLQLGEAGSADAITLFRQNGELIELICRGSEGLISSSFTVRIRVVHKYDEWKVFADPSGGNDFHLDALGSDQGHSTSSFTGIYCKYTSSNAKKMYFDDIYSGPIIIDSLPPELLGVGVRENILDVRFSESLDGNSAENPVNYQLNDLQINPDSLWLDAENHSIVHLIFKDGFTNATNYMLTIDNVCDPTGNCMGLTSFPFAYFIPHPYDVVINELMVDPVPAMGLPEHEYVELHNLTPFKISLEGWSLLVGTGVKEIHDVAIAANGFLLLCKESDACSLSFFGAVYGLSGLSLNNSGQSLMLMDDKGMVISLLVYDDGWYGNDDKADGGWSLEMINPFNPCAGKANWSASVNMEGGTPGAPNSVLNELDIPVLPEKACYINDSTFELYFNQYMDTIFLKNPEAYRVNYGIGEPVGLRVDSPVSTRVFLVFDHQFQPGTIYNLEVDQVLNNCVGTALFSSRELKIGVPEDCLYNDLVINEILFNPLSGGEDYVEVYNRSDKIIELSEIILSSIKINFPNPADTISKSISDECRLCFPGEYLLLSKNINSVQDQYHTNNPEAFVNMESFPAYNNDRGRVALFNASGMLIDHFQYNEDMHHPLLNSIEGVSLERIHYDQPSRDKNNWHSAAAQVGFGTPGYQNSQYLPVSIVDDPIHLDPEIIFPDCYSGENSTLGIFYQFDHPGNIANILIFNSCGQLIRTLVQSELLGTNGVFSWNGLDDRNLRAETGIYVVLVEVFYVEGSVKRYKGVVVVGER